MRKKLLVFLISFSVNFVNAQNSVESPFDIYGPRSAPVYKDLKEALKDYERVYKLNLTNQTLEPKLYGKLGKLSALQALMLGNNNITFLPDNIGAFSSLMYFSTRGNEISSLPKGFGNLTSLMHLEL